MPVGIKYNYAVKKLLTKVEKKYLAPCNLHMKNFHKEKEMTSPPETERDDFENILSNSDFEDYREEYTSLKHVLSNRYAQIKASKRLNCTACEQKYSDLIVKDELKIAEIKETQQENLDSKKI